jgi:hypothetical protein
MIGPVRIVVYAVVVVVVNGEVDVKFMLDVIKLSFCSLSKI